MPLFCHKKTIKRLPLLLVSCLICLNSQARAVSSSYEIYLGADETFTTSEDIILDPTSYKGVISMRGDNITVNNNHVLRLANSTSSSSVYGIYLFSLSGDVSGITIMNNQTIDITGNNNEGTFGIKTENIENSVIHNNGDIMSASTSRWTRGIYVGNMTNSTITNEGNIIADSSGYNVGIQVNLLDENSIISNSGTITTPIVDSLGNFGILIEGGSGSITNTGTITSAMAIWGQADYTGTITNDATGILNGRIEAVNAKFINNATINLPMGSNVVKNYTQSTTGTLGVKLNIADDGSSQYSGLYASESATLENGAKIHVDVTASDTGAGAFLAADSVLIGIISSQNAIDVDTSLLNITDNSALLDFEALLSFEDKYLSLHVIEQAISDVVDNANPSNSVAQVLDALDNSEANLFRGYLNTLPTNESVTKALKQVTPQNTLNTQNVSHQITNAMSQVVQARQSNVRGFSSGDVVFSDKNIWIKPFGGYTSQDDVDGIDGFSANTYGFGMGLDGEYKNGIRAGLAFFYTKADVDTNNVAQSSDLDVFSLVAYGSNPIIDDKTNLFYQLSYGLQKTETTRVVSGVGIGSADYTAKNFFAQLKAMREIQINESLKIRPALVSSYTHFYSPSYSESGLGGLNLDVDKFSSSSFVLGVESDFIYSLDETSKLSASVGLSYDFNNDAQSLTSSFQGGGTVFSTAGIENSAFIYKAGLGYIKKLQDNLFIDMQYDFEGRGNDVQNHVISSKINYKF